MICKLQLHHVAFMTIAPAIDFIYAYYIPRFRDYQERDFQTCAKLINCFDYLPLSYNEKGFNLLVQRLIDWDGRDKPTSIELPFRRMSPAQVEAVLKKYQQNYSLKNIVFFGNERGVMSHILKSPSYPNYLYQQLLAHTHRPNNNQDIMNVIITASILIDYYNNPAPGNTLRKEEGR